jgi:hypothetical protein
LIGGLTVIFHLAYQSFLPSLVKLDQLVEGNSKLTASTSIAEKARRLHTGAFRAIDASVTQQRELIVSGYDGLLGEIHVLIRFESDLVECQVIYAQPITCKVIE